MSRLNPPADQTWGLPCSAGPPRAVDQNHGLFFPLFHFPRAPFSSPYLSFYTKIPLHTAVFWCTLMFLAQVVSLRRVLRALTSITCSISRLLPLFCAAGAMAAGAQHCGALLEPIPAHLDVILTHIQRIEHRCEIVQIEGSWRPLPIVPARVSKSGRASTTEGSCRPAPAIRSHSGHQTVPKQSVEAACHLFCSL